MVVVVVIVGGGTRPLVAGGIGQPAGTGQVGRRTEPDHEGDGDDRLEE
jgi:hypothetical protein